MTTKNGILNPREAAQKLYLPAGFTLRTYGKLDYSLSQFTVELWVKPHKATKTRHALVQVGDFALNFTTHSGITLGLPPLTPGGSSSEYTSQNGCSTTHGITCP